MARYRIGPTALRPFWLYVCGVWRGGSANSGDGVDGSVLYLPPGVHRITVPLSPQNSTGVRSIGVRSIGGIMLLNGIAYSRFIGFELDSGRKAKVGFRYQSTQGFQTEVTHRHLAFRGFNDAALFIRTLQFASLLDFAERKSSAASLAIQDCLGYLEESTECDTSLRPPVLRIFPSLNSFTLMSLSTPRR